MAIANDIIRKQGDTYPIEVSIIKESGVPLDLSGAVDFLLGVSSTETIVPPAVPELLLGGAASSEIGGQVSFHLTNEQASSLQPGNYFAEIQFTQNGFIITTETFGYRVKGHIVT